MRKVREGTCPKLAAELDRGAGFLPPSPGSTLPLFPLVVYIFSGVCKLNTPTPTPREGLQAQLVAEVGWGVDLTCREGM